MSCSSLPLRLWLLLITLWVGAVWAWAHAIIVESSPKMNGVVTGPVVEISLRFNVRVDGARSRLTLVKPDGTSHAVEVLRQSAADSLAATVAGLHPGKYQLHWQVLASDGHITQGDIPFTDIAR